MANDIETDTDKDYIRLHVGGLSSDVTDKDLRDRFNSFGKILSIDVVKGFDCACRGFAYINFDKSADIKKCISILDRTRWRGNLLTIQRANADYMAKRSAELEARRKREEETGAKRKDALVVLEENAAAKDKAGLWVVNKHGLVLPVLRITNNNGKVVKINPNMNKFKNNVKRLAADSSGEENNFSDDEVGEAPKKISEDIEIINEDQMEIDEEETPAIKAEVGYPFSDDEDDRNYISRDEDDDVPVVPANVLKEKKSALSILEQMFPEEKEFIHKKDAKMEKIRAVAMKETVPVGPGVKEALAKIEAKKAAEKAAATAATVAKQVPTKIEPVKETKTKEVKKQAEAVKETKPKEVEKKADPIKEPKAKVEVEKKEHVEPVKETKVQDVFVEKKLESVPQTPINTKKRSREEESSRSSSDDESSDHEDSSSTTSSASSSTEFFESIKRRKIMESTTKQAAPENKKTKTQVKETKAKPVVQEQPKKITVTEVEVTKKEAEEIKEIEQESSSSSEEEEGGDSDSDSDSSSTTSSASSSTEFFEEIRRRKLLEQKVKDEKPGKDKTKKAKQQEAVVSTPVEPAEKETPKVSKKEDTAVVYKPVAPVVQGTTIASTEAQSAMQVDEENGKSWVDIMTQYETERLKPVTILAPKAVWKLFPDRDDNTTAALSATGTSGNAMEIEATTDKPDEEADIGVNSKDYKPFFPFIGNGPKLIGDTLVRTKTLEEIESEWRREKVFLTQDYKKKRSIAVKKRRKLEKKQR